MLSSPSVSSHSQCLWPFTVVNGQKSVGHRGLNLTTYSVIFWTEKNSTKDILMPPGKQHSRFRSQGCRQKKAHSSAHSLCIVPLRPSTHLAGYFITEYLPPAVFKTVWVHMSLFLDRFPKPHMCIYVYHICLTMHATLMHYYSFTHSFLRHLDSPQQLNTTCVCVQCFVTHWAVMYDRLSVCARM